VLKEKNKLLDGKTPVLILK